MNGLNTVSIMSMLLIKKEHYVDVMTICGGIEETTFKILQLSSDVGLTMYLYSSVH